MSLFGALAVSASGMDAQRVRAELITENLANADTTRTPQGGPYRRKDAVFTSAQVNTTFGDSFAQSLASLDPRPMTGVSVARVIVDESDPERRYIPGHPDADPQGYVAFPKINPAEEMVDLMGASRSYQANVTAISSVKDMIARSIELFR
jgi:flagellar basal-body rod protein FlgC